MYRNYIKTSLEIDKLKEINRNAPENVKYCNFFCQDFRDKQIFGKQRSYCKDWTVKNWKKTTKLLLRLT